MQWGTAIGGLIASCTVVDAYAVKALGIAPVVLDWFSNLLRFFMLLPLVLANLNRAVERMRGFWWIAIGVDLLSPLSYILVLAALTTGAPLSLVAPMRYFNGDYHREDSKLIRSAKSWQLTHSWTTEQDMPCGRFRIVAYSPKKDVKWSRNWQEREQQSLEQLIPEIVESLGASKVDLQRLMEAEEAAEDRRKNEQKERWERYEREEADAERTQLALDSSGSQGVTPDMLKTFACKARERIRLDNGGYHRDHLRALAQRVEVAEDEIRLMGSKSELLRTLVAASSVETATFGVHSSVLKWRTRQDSNL